MIAKLGHSRLGFGCAAIPGALTRREALALLERALDCGVAHFDVARMYDNGRAEGAVGELARRRRDEMVIVSKTGIAPPGLARRALHAGPRFGRFAPAQIRASVEASLRALQTDRLDALLLHECAPEHVTNELKRELETLKTQGKALAIGIACTPDQTEALIALHRDLCTVVQASTAMQITPPPGATRILHSVLGSRLSWLTERLTSSAVLAQTFTRDVGVSPAEPGAIAGLFLRQALTRADVVLFATTDAAHLERNAALAQSAADTTALTAFSSFINHADAPTRAT